MNRRSILELFASKWIAPGSVLGPSSAPSCSPDLGPAARADTDLNQNPLRHAPSTSTQTALDQGVLTIVASALLALAACADELPHDAEEAPDRVVLDATRRSDPDERAEHQAQIVPPLWEIERITVSGDGCDAQNTETLLDPGRQRFTIRFAGYALTAATAEEGVRCAVRVRLVAGESSRVVFAGYRGAARVEIPAGVNGNLSLTASFASSPDEARTHDIPLFGGAARPIRFDSVLTQRQQGTSKCGGADELTLALHLTASALERAGGLAVVELAPILDMFPCQV